MPRITRLFIKTGLVYFLLALITGVVYLGQPLGLSNTTTAAFFAPYIHLFMFGWITQLIIGVASWLFPAATRQKHSSRPYLLYTAYIGINLGLASRAVFEPWIALGPETGVIKWVLTASALLQWVGGTAFVIDIWSRVK